MSFGKNIFTKEGKISIQACVTILVNIQKAYMVTYKDWAKKKNGVPNQKQYALNAVFVLYLFAGIIQNQRAGKLC